MEKLEKLGDTIMVGIVVLLWTFIVLLTLPITIPAFLIGWVVKWVTNDRYL